MPASWGVKIPITATLTKLDLTRLLLDKQGQQLPVGTTLYDGKIHNLPNTLAQLNKLNVPKLRAILKYYNFPIVGSKDELVLHVFLLRQGKTVAILNREMSQIKDLIQVTDEPILALKYLNLSVSHHTYFERTNASNLTKSNSFVVPGGVYSLADLKEIFIPLVQHMSKKQAELQHQDENSLAHLNKASLSTGTCTGTSTSSTVNETSSLKEQLIQIGAKIKIKWTAEDIGKIGWRPGWYNATVQSYDDETGTLSVVYTAEPDCVYTMEIDEVITNNTIRLVKSVI